MIVAAMLDDNRMHFMPVIEIDGVLWIVPAWIPEHDGQFATPERAIRLDQFPFERFGLGAQYQFGIHGILPKELFFGELPPKTAAAYTVIRRPNWRVRVDLSKPH
jgi:hypothetical protein